MGLQSQIAEAIIIAFDDLGGDPQRAVEAAMRHHDTESWIQSESTVGAIAGGAEMAIPGLHTLTIPAGISYLIHKMASVSWGVGAQKEAFIVETPYYSDLRNILTLWANASYYNPGILNHYAISTEIFEYIMTEEGHAKLAQAAQLATDDTNVDKVTRNTIRVLQTLSDQYATDERALRLMQTLVGTKPANAMADAAEALPNFEPNHEEQIISRRIGAQLAARLAARISMRVPARLVMGFIPIAGALVNAFFNNQTLRNMADTAVKYYNHSFKVADLEAILEAVEES